MTTSVKRAITTFLTDAFMKYLPRPVVVYFESTCVISKQCLETWPATKVLRLLENDLLAELNSSGIYKPTRQVSEPQEAVSVCTDASVVRMGLHMLL